MTSPRVRRVALLLYRYFVFFLIVSFIITSCTMLFLAALTKSAELELTADNISVAAKLTFLNVIFLSLVLTLADALRRRFTLELPARRITRAAERIMHGDFSVRLKRPRSIDGADILGDICDCFNKMAEELASTEMLSTDFVSNVSHELKTPLAAIGNYASMLSSPVLTDSERTEYARAIVDASRRLSELITNILRLNKLENQQIIPDIRRYDLGEQLCECLLGFESEWDSKQINIETDIEDGIYVRTDMELLTLVWNNLFSNAIKFTDSGGTVSLSLHTDGNFAVVSVGDTGCGISSEAGARIFEKFYQADTSRATRGNGLGLALVKRVIDITGSEISVKSKLGEGSVFTVRIRRENGSV